MIASRSKAAIPISAIPPFKELCIEAERRLHIAAQHTFEHETANDRPAVSAQDAFADLGPAEVALTFQSQTYAFTFVITCRTSAVTQQSLRVPESWLLSQFVIQYDSIGEPVPPQSACQQLGPG